MFKLVIDVSETKFLAVIPESFPPFEKKRLICGDFAFYHKDNLVAVVERKTLNDLDSSVVDGRFAEQRTSLLDLRSQNPGILILYMIEGTIKDTRFFAPESRKRVQGALENMAIEHSICCLHTVDVADTVDRLMSLYRKLELRFQREGCDVTIKTIPLSRKAKIGNNILACQLNVISGVGMSTAVSIAERYGNMSKLIEAWKTSDRPEELLTTIPFKRKIGKALSLRIYQSHFT